MAANKTSIEINPSTEGSQIKYCVNPSLDRLRDYKVVAAFDFGTTYSGYAFSTKSNQDDIHLNKAWGYQFAIENYKTPTVILTDDDKNCVAFGYDAMTMYKGNECDHHMYDQSFKMRLYETQTAKDCIEVESIDGKQSIPLFALVTMTIKFLYEHMKDALKRGNAGLDESGVRVVITVPAIWSDSAKDFIKRAACQAGIESNRLMLALEPEAASLYCRTLKPSELQSNKAVHLPNGTRYLVLDCGGGTVDISVHEVVDNDSLKEIHCANGGPWGGQNVNKRFNEALDDLFGATFLEKYKYCHPFDWFVFNKDFEIIKRTYIKDSEHNINLPSSLIKTFESKGLFKKDIAKHFSKQKKTGYTFKDGRLVMEADILTSFFTPIVEKILDHINKLWKNGDIASVKYTFLVGGYSDSNLLFDTVSKAIAKLNPLTQVVRPPKASVAVVIGAVKFGHNPNAIKSRISRMTYGAGVMGPFIPNVHDPSKKIETEDDGDKCIDLFAIWAKKNEKIAVGEKRTFTIYPNSKHATFFSVDIFAVDREHVMYTTEVGVQKLASLEIPIPDRHLPQYDREIKHYVYFGGTELHVRIEDAARAGGASNEAIIKYEYNHPI